MQYNRQIADSFMKDVGQTKNTEKSGKRAQREIRKAHEKSKNTEKSVKDEKARKKVIR